MSNWCAWLVPAGGLRETSGWGNLPHGITALIVFGCTKGDCREGVQKLQCRTGRVERPVVLSHRNVLGLTGQVESFSQVSCPSLRRSLWLGERNQAQWGEQHPCHNLRSLPRASLLPLGQMLASRALLTPPLLSCPFQVHI